jgi:hypothetical protein
MLYKNDVLYKMSAQDHKDLKKKFPKWPIRLTYPEARVRQSRQKHNRLPDKPNSISFPFAATVKTKTGADIWRYAENRINGTDGQIIWAPNNLVLRGVLILKDTDVELAFWLWKCCPYLQGGENYNGKVPKCVFEDLVGAADRKAAKEEALVTVKAMIYSSKVGLGEKRLRQIAKAYFISEVDDLSFSQVKVAVENTIHRDKRNGPEKFLELAEADQVLEVKANLQRAIDGKVITYMAHKKIWAWVTNHGTSNIPITEIGAVNDPYEALYEYYLTDRKFAQELVSAVKGEEVTEDAE